MIAYESKYFSVCFGLLSRSNTFFSEISSLLFSTRVKDCYEMSGELVQIALENLEFFKKAKARNKKFHEFCKIFEALIETVIKLQLLVKNIEDFAPDYDFDKLTPGNGYRSFIDVYDSAIKRTVKLCIRVEEKRESFFFRKTFYEK